MIDIRDEYFEWLVYKVSGHMCDGPVSYRKLFYSLHDTPFRYVIRKDENREKDGIELRYRFALDKGYPESVEYELDAPCSVLEMMVAIAIRCEESIMDDPQYGDRTHQWFRSMIVSLGLGSMSDDRFNRVQVDMIINRFLDRQYEPDGYGGLFTLRRWKSDTSPDLRDIEIIHQLYLYLDELV